MVSLSVSRFVRGADPTFHCGDMSAERTLRFIVAICPRSGPYIINLSPMANVPATSGSGQMRRYDSSFRIGISIGLSTGLAAASSEVEPAHNPSTDKKKD